MIIVSNCFPVPTVDEIMEELHGWLTFSKLDLKLGYYQIIIVSKSRAELSLCMYMTVIVTVICKMYKYPFYLMKYVSFTFFIEYSLLSLISLSPRPNPVRHMTEVLQYFLT